MVVVGTPTLAYGGIVSQTVRATNTGIFVFVVLLLAIFSLIVFFSSKKNGWLDKCGLRVISYRMLSLLSKLN